MCKIQNMILVGTAIPVLTLVETTKFVFRYICVKGISMVCTRKGGVPVKMQRTVKIANVQEVKPGFVTCRCVDVVGEEYAICKEIQGRNILVCKDNDGQCTIFVEFAKSHIAFKVPQDQVKRL